ncbi:hypothetical protein ES703_90806 [subsurface metagenome]
MSESMFESFSNSPVAEKVKLDTRIVLHRTRLSPEDMAVIRQSKEYGPIPREQEVCELEVGGQVIARGRIIRKKGAWYFKVRETAEKERKQGEENE